MKQFEAKLAWRRDGQPFTDQRYSRAHQWSFDGGLAVPASSSPLSVPLPMSDPSCVDPEEALVAAASSCHMLFFLSIAAQRGYVIDEYHDHAVGTLDRDSDGKLAMTKIVLRPAITYAGGRSPESAEAAQMHHLSHEKCYIASSLKADVVIEEAR